jgi:hypothetical protein
LTRNRLDGKTASDRRHLPVDDGHAAQSVRFVYFRSTADPAGHGAIYRGISTQ